MERHDQLEEWVNRRVTSSQAPREWPAADAARRRLGQRIAAGPPRRVIVWSSVAAAACATILVMPQPRTVAQRLWDQVVINRFQVVIADNDDIDVGLFTPEVQRRPEAIPMPSAEEASRVAGFSPRRPGPRVFAIAPTYSVTDMTSATLRLRASAIRALFTRAGGSPGEVPDDWEGAVLEVRVGPVIIADYGGALLLQSQPFELITPAAFDLEAFYRIAFRSLGLDEQEARVLSTDLGISPALLTFMPMEDKDLVHEFPTKRGTGMMIEDVYGAGTVLAVWTGSDRIYALFLKTATIVDEFVREVANALD